MICHPVGLFLSCVGQSSGDTPGLGSCVTCQPVRLFLSRVGQSSGDANGSCISDIVTTNCNLSVSVIMSEAVRARTAARGWTTRASNKLDSVCKLAELDKETLIDAIEEFDKRIQTLDDAQNNVEIELDEAELLEDISKAADFREKVRKPRIIATKLLSTLMPKSDGDSDTGTRASGSVGAKLPKLKLPSFSGDPLQWQTFWDQFSAIIDDSDMPEITKFSYLQSLLQGEAKAAIQGLSLTAAHYKTACDILKERFGRKERIIFTHIQELLNLSVPKQAQVSVLWKLQDDLQAHIRSLESLGISGAQYGAILTPLILSRLPSDIRLEWSRDGAGHENDLNFLLDFLKKEIERRERSQTFKDSTDQKSAVFEKKPTKVATAAALQTSSDPRCLLCSKNHATERCWNLTKISVAERKDKIRAAGLCYRCIGKGHLANRCREKCARCNGNHHLLLCTGNSPNREPVKQTDVKQTDTKQTSSTSSGSVSHTGVSNASVNTRQRVLLQSARVTARGQRGFTEATVLFDTGSDRSYVSSELVNKINPEWVGSQQVAYAAFGCNKPGKSALRNVFQVHLQGSNGAGQSLFATEVPVICTPIFRPEVQHEVLESLGDFSWADNYETGEQVKVDILIGMDSYWKFMKPTVVSIPDGLSAQETVFGWVVSGSLRESSQSREVVSHQLLCLNDIPEASLRSFWELESIGIVQGENTSVRDPVLGDFDRNVKFVDGRYEVVLPWKPASPGKRLVNNEGLARKRLDSLTRKLDKDPQLQERYDQALSDMETSGVIEEVPPQELVSEHPTFYMPHRPVIREASVSTKIRPVFDASAASYNGISLNDCLETGPNLMPDLVEILIRFRRWQVAITGDITKAFLQIQVQKSDRDVHRFLWKLKDDVRVMRFLRVPFGNCSSPFLLNATIKHHLSTVPQTPVVQELQDNLFVDDFISGADSDEEGCDVINESACVMDKASMTLSKWCSNSAFVADMLNREFSDKNLTGEPSVKVLGIRWLAEQDCFSFDGVETPGGLCVTKRVVLSFIARLFDPLGLVTPFVMTAKCLFQELWKLGLQWDEPVPVAYQTSFERWVDGLECLRNWQVPRNYTGGRWRDIRHLELHAFGDASDKGYGACVYLRAELQDGSCVSSLVMSKAKVAPLKKVTVPRLELLGALLCSRLLVFVRQALKLPMNVDYMCWTDSMVALSWIRSEPGRWKAFVANRVAEIHDLTSPDKWSHCPGSENPADLVTRGVTAQELVSSAVWLHGPEFLIEGCRDISGDEQPVEVTLNVLGERNDEEISLLSTDGVQGPMFEVSRWGTLGKAIRVVGWVLRFIHNVRGHTSEGRAGDLSLKELGVAKLTLIRCVQQEEYGSEWVALKDGRLVPSSSPIAKLSPFIGEDDLLRVQGRLQFSQLAFEEKHPIIVPKSHLSLLLIRFQHKLMKHAGVATMITSLRGQYWLVGGRRLAKRVKKECVSCQRLDAPAGSQIWAPLPDLRVTQTPPFSVTGMDHAGPLYCSDAPRKKFYVLLFTCAVVRAVHFELVDSMSCADTMLALRRFAARRGLPSVLYSDNARGFVKSQGELMKHFGHLSPEWKFIVPRSPWWGGWWERLVRSMKSALKKSVGTQCLSRTELETTLHECEAFINSRPLTFVGDDLDSKDPLTPSHFLIGRSAGFQPASGQGVPVSTAQELVDRYEVRRQLLDQFWSAWSSDYIRNLPTWQGCKPRGKLTEGSVVLIQDEGCARLQWPMGVVSGVIPGKDGLIRAVHIKTSKGVLTRPIQKVHDLEIVQGSFSKASTARDTSKVVHANDARDTSEVVHANDARDTEVKIVDNPGNVQEPVFTESDQCDIITNGNAQKTRRGRAIKPPKRLDL